MKNTLISLSILTASCFLVFNLSSCKSKAAVNQTAPAETATCKVIVDFASIGGGINYPQYEKLTQLLNSKKVKYTEKSKGREGEKEVCIPLSELKGQEKTDFIEQLKKFEDKSTYISVSVN
jgi:hypothetical protein